MPVFSTSRSLSPSLCLSLSLLNGLCNQDWLKEYDATTDLDAVQKKLSECSDLIQTLVPQHLRVDAEKSQKMCAPTLTSLSAPVSHLDARAYFDAIKNKSCDVIAALTVVPLDIEHVIKKHLGTLVRISLRTLKTVHLQESELAASILDALAVATQVLVDKIKSSFGSTAKFGQLHQALGSICAIFERSCNY
jgi:hypothetical protein